MHKQLSSNTAVKSALNQWGLFVPDLPTGTHLRRCHWRAMISRSKTCHEHDLQLEASYLELMKPVTFHKGNSNSATTMVVSESILGCLQLTRQEGALRFLPFAKPLDPLPVKVVGLFLCAERS
jgi:hypothetical protein